MAEPGGQLERICVIGCGGTGKSTLSRVLGERLRLPVVHIDTLYWKPGWTPGTNADLAAKLEKIVAGPRWVIDGNFASTMPGRFQRSQAIIWLDLPTHEALWGALRRVAHGKGRVRPDMAEGCAEGWDWEFTRWVAEFRSKDRPRLVENIEHYGSHAKLFRIKRRREIRTLVEQLAASL